MPIIVFVESADGEIKKSSLEAVGYASEVAKKLNTTAVAIAIGKYSSDALQGLGKFGAAKVLHVSDDKFSTPSGLPYATVIAQAAIKENSDLVILAKSALVDGMAARIAMKLNAAVVSNKCE